MGRPEEACHRTPSRWQSLGRDAFAPPEVADEVCLGPISAHTFGIVRTQQRRCRSEAGRAVNRSQDLPLARGRVAAIWITPVSCVAFRVGPVLGAIRIMRGSHPWPPSPDLAAVCFVLLPEGSPQSGLLVAHHENVRCEKEEASIAQKRQRLV